MLLASIPLPTIPKQVFNITAYGAVASAADNTTAIQNCINAASAAGGGIVEIPAAAQDWECGPMNLASKIDLQIDSGATLQMLPYGTYPLPTGATSYPNFIEASHLNNVEISGSGTIDGNGSLWWTAYNNGSLTVRRPQMIAIDSCSIVLIQGLTLTNPPNTHVSLQNACNDATVQNITIATVSPSPNTDGIDVSGTNMVFQNLNISDGDDNIALGAGASPGANPETGNITITNCIFGYGHGLSIGSYTSGGVANVTVSNCSFTNTTAGIRMKSERGRGGVVENISYYNITMSNVEYAIDINSYYNQGAIPTTPTDPPQNVPETPVWENITIGNVTSVTGSSQSNYSGSYCGCIWGVPEDPVNGVTLSNVQLSARYGMDLNHVRGVTLDSTCKITPLGGGGAEISTYNGAAPDTPYDVVVTAANYSAQDIGSPAKAGSPLFNPDTGLWSILAGGTGIGGASDQFSFVFTPLTANATYMAKVTSLTNSNAAAAAGVMFRDSTDTASSAFAAVVVTPGDGLEFEWRASNGASAASPTTITGIVAPTWVEVVRNGNNFTGFYSSNGTAWTQIGTSESVSMSSTALAGLAVSANSGSATTTAGFSNLAGPSITAAPAASPQPATGTTANLSVTASETGSTLTYSWSILSSPSGVTSPTFSVNGTSAAKNTTATFYAFGVYEFLATVTDSNGVSATAVLGVGVNQTPVAVTISPASASLGANGTQLFTASATDQFGVAFEPVFTWSLASGVGVQNSSFGLYTAPATAGSATVKATAGSASGTATVTIGPI
ncbi:MAG: glycosyl hydrolase family 28 protein, partial [Tepidisphaeraceae bacterium]